MDTAKARRERTAHICTHLFEFNGRERVDVRRRANEFIYPQLVLPPCAATIVMIIVDVVALALSNSEHLPELRWSHVVADINGYRAPPLFLSHGPTEYHTLRYVAIAVACDVVLRVRVASSTFVSVDVDGFKLARVSLQAGMNSLEKMRINLEKSRTPALAETDRHT